MLICFHFVPIASLRVVTCGSEQTNSFTMRSYNCSHMNSISNNTQPPKATLATLPIVGLDSFLTLHYRLSGPSGDVINTFNEKPATLSIGTGELSPSMEHCLIGMTEGQKAIFSLSKGEAFGSHNPDMVQWVSKDLLSKMGTPGETYQVGEVVEFPAPNGQGTYAGVVKAVKPEQVLFDFNHPLVDQELSFEVHIIGIL